MRLHLVPECHPANGVFRLAELMAAREGGRVLPCTASVPDLRGYDEVWVHGMWLPSEWRACVRTLAAKGPALVRMTHGSLSPIYLARRSPWRKRFAAPVERFLFARAARVAVTGSWEEEWFRAWWGRRPSPVFEYVDPKTFFDLAPGATPAWGVAPRPRPMNVLYLGRAHPLKGVDALRDAVETFDGRIVLTEANAAFGAEKARLLAQCDVLAVPSLSENFGLVAAEALAAGRRVIATDGAPAWRGQAGVLFLDDFRICSRAVRTARLREALFVLLKAFTGESKDRV